MLGKLLLLALGVWVILRLLKHYQRSLEPQPQAKEKAEDMVQCAQCGLRLPQSESIMAEGTHFCCEAHRQQARP